MVTYDELQLAKLTIDAYKDQRFNEPAASWRALFNPNELKFKRRNTYSNQPAAGTSRPATSFSSGEPDELSIEFFFDGTGVVDTADSVRGRLEALLELTRLQPETHLPYYVHLHWGSFHFRGVLHTAEVTYTLFDRRGEPVRATVACTFQQVMDPEDTANTERVSSADLHQTWLAGQDETLDLIAYRVYGSAAFWRPIAEHNSLPNPRAVPTGTVLVLPPKAR